jgi:N-acyl-L-homoserine lactone synthetase
MFAGVSIVLADAEQRAAAHRLRYDVFTREMGDERYADHRRRVFVDESDEDLANPLLVALAGGDVVGSLRILPRRGRPVRHEHLSRFESLAATLALTCRLSSSVSRS